jgi:uncharacterized membrane protein YgcG
MNIFRRTAGFLIHRSGKQNLVSLLLWALCLSISPQSLLASQDQDVPPQQQDVQQGPGQLQQLVAPIALYPDSLVSQILAASTYPEQVVEADRWVQAHPALQGEALGQAVDQQPWDPSIKALTAFPSVLGNMDKNLSWTSALGDAYYNQQSDVMDAVQAMRKVAQASGNLQSDPQETVTTQDSNISIEPADPDDVYVPAYDPWVVYGDPVAAWPGWYAYPGIWFGGPNPYFGAHFGIGWHRGYGWGWNHWGVDWRGRSVLYDHNRFHSSSTTFYSRNAYNRGGVEHIDHRESDNHPVEPPQPFKGDTRAARGYAEPRDESGIRSNAFSGYDHGGEERGFSSRGSESFGGGGGFHGGGGRR